MPGPGGNTAAVAAANNPAQAIMRLRIQTRGLGFGFLVAPRDERAGGGAEQARIPERHAASFGDLDHRAGRGGRTDGTSQHAGSRRPTLLKPGNYGVALVIES